jgi:hypothetical protein
MILEKADGVTSLHLWTFLSAVGHEWHTFHILNP